MNRLVLYTFFIFFMSCVGSDTAFFPTTIHEAKEKKLLISIYESNHDTININNKKYKIEDCFTTHKFISTNNKSINEKIFLFIFKLKNIKTGEEFERENINPNFYEYINFYSENGGIINSNLSIYYYDIKMKNKLDTIKIGFKDNLKKEQVVLFVKQNK